MCGISVRKADHINVDDHLNYKQKCGGRHHKISSHEPNACHAIHQLLEIRNEIECIYACVYTNK